MKSFTQLNLKLNDVLDKYIIINLKRKIFWTYLLVILSLLIVPFIYISLFVNPIADDYSLCLISHKLNFFEYTRYFYQTLSGRYAAGLAVYLLKIINLFTIVKVFPIIIILLSIYSTYLLFNKLFEKHLLINFSLSIIINFIFYTYMPWITHGLYWFTGSATYALSWIFISYFYSFYLDFEKGNLKSYKKILFILIIIFVVGLNECTLIFVNLILILKFFKSLIEKNLSYYLIFILALSVTFSIISIIAPGNYVRLNYILNSASISNVSNYKNILFSVNQSIHLFFIYLINFKFIILLVFMLFGLYEMSLNNNKLIKKDSLINLFSSVLLFVLLPLVIFPAFYTSNCLYPRTGNLFFWIILFSTVLISKFVFFYLKKHLVNFRGLITMIMCILIILISMQFLLYTNGTKAVYSDLYRFKASKYNNQLNLRYDMMKKNSKYQVFPKLNNIPYSIYHGEISDNPNNWVNKVTAEYFKVDSIAVK